MRDYSKLTTSQSRLPQLFCVILCDFTAHLKFGANDSVLDFFLGTVGGLYTCMCMCVFYVLLLQCTFPPPLCRATWIVLQSSSVSILVVLWICRAWIHLCCTWLESSPSSSSVSSWWSAGQWGFNCSRVKSFISRFSHIKSVYLQTSLIGLWLATSTPGSSGSNTAWMSAIRSFVVGTSPSRTVLLLLSNAASSEMISRWTAAHVVTGCMIALW